MISKKMFTVIISCMVLASSMNVSANADERQDLTEEMKDSIRI